MKPATDRSTREAAAAAAAAAVGSDELARPPRPASRSPPPRRKRPARLDDDPGPPRRRRRHRRAVASPPSSSSAAAGEHSPSPPGPAPCPCARSAVLAARCSACSPATEPPRASESALSSSSSSPSTTATAATAPAPAPPPRARDGPDADGGGGSGSTSASSASTAAPSPAAGAGGADAALSFWGPDPVPLPPRFGRVKRGLVAGHEAALEAGWARLVHALRAEVDHIDALGPHLIPSVEFADLDDAAQTARFGRDLRRYGVGVVRAVLPRAFAEAAVADTVRYLGRRRASPGPGPGSGPGPGPAAPRLRAPRQDPTCYDCFWTPAQVRCRAHPNVLRAQRFMMGLWDAADGLATRRPVAYADRIRVEGGGFDADAAKAAADSGPGPAAARRSADDWIAALQSSAGIIAQVDNGSLERWEPDGYGRGGTYDAVFAGRWERYDPWRAASRVGASIDLYNGHGACSILRLFQGLLALSTTEPGMLRLLPSPRLATAYYLLRPFFRPRRPAPPRRSGPAWDAYLAPDNWELRRDPDTIVHGAVPGHAQRLTERWHPHLALRASLVTLPTLRPGDYILWHPDLPYHFSRGPRRAADAVSMLVYVPAAPLTQTNALYLARQRNAFRRGLPGPDFDSGARAVPAEDSGLRPGEPDIEAVGGEAALRAMGLAPWDEDEDESAPGGEPVASDAEADIVRLANLILFPK